MSVRSESISSFWPRTDHFRSSLVSGYFQIPPARSKSVTGSGSIEPGAHTSGRGCAQLKFLPVTSIVLCRQERGTDALKFVFTADDGELSMDVLLTQQRD